MRGIGLCHRAPHGMMVGSSSVVRSRRRRSVVGRTFCNRSPHTSSEIFHKRESTQTGYSAVSYAGRLSDEHPHVVKRFPMLHHQPEGADPSVGVSSKAQIRGVRSTSWTFDLIRCGKLGIEAVTARYPECAFVGIVRASFIPHEPQAWLTLSIRAEPILLSAAFVVGHVRHFAPFS
jgi:hypothetical protein